MTDNHMRRDDPPRTESNRSTSRTQTRSGRAGPPTGDQSGVINRAVDLAYKVVDSHILQGQRAAAGLRAGTYSSSDFDKDLKQCLDRALELSKEFGALGVDMFDAIRRMTGPRWGLASISGDVAVELRNKKKTAHVNVHLHPSSTRFSPTVPPLHSADRSKPPLTDVHLRVGEDHRPVLIVNFPDDHPHGVYTGTIVDSETHEAGGFISVRILDENKP